MSLRPEFWRHFSLAEMTPEEWEAVCDGCGHCCLHKLEDMDTGELFYTDVACGLLDRETCRCQDYVHRKEQVPDCIKLTLSDLKDYKWLPPTCAYRLLAANEALPAWHPLVCGDREAIHQAGVSVRGRCVSEHDVNELEEHIVTWWR